MEDKETFDLARITTVADLKQVKQYLLDQKENTKNLDVPIGDYTDSPMAYLNGSLKMIEKILAIADPKDPIRATYCVGDFNPIFIFGKALVQNADRYRMVDYFGNEYRSIRKIVDKKIRDYFLNNADKLQKLKAIINKNKPESQDADYVINLEKYQYLFNDGSLMNVELNINLNSLLLNDEPNSPIAYVVAGYAPDGAGMYCFYQEICDWKDFHPQLTPERLYAFKPTYSRLGVDGVFDRHVDRIIRTGKYYASPKVFDHHGHEVPLED